MNKNGCLLKREATAGFGSLITAACRAKRLVYRSKLVRSAKAQIALLPVNAFGRYDFSEAAAGSCGRLRVDPMSEAIQNIVDAYVKLGNAEALQQLKDHRQGLVMGFDGRSDYGFELILEQLKDEIEQIELGLTKIRQPNGSSSAT
jgi:hypothetical protein